VILSEFWSRYDLQNFRKRSFLGDDQGELSKGTVCMDIVVHAGVRFCPAQKRRLSVPFLVG
jgi:hypothetical protein